MSARWIVDGVNVVGARPDGWWRDRTAALSRLVDDVVRWRSTVAGPVAVDVVVDGRHDARLPEGPRHGVVVHHAPGPGPDAADHAVVARLAACTAEAVAATRVATSDRELRRRCRALGATVEGAGTFRDRLEAAAAAERARLAALGDPDAPLLGQGGEARVFAIADDRVARIPHVDVPDALEARRRVLDALGAVVPGTDVVLPEVLEHRRVHDRVVAIERRLPGRPGRDALVDAHDRDRLVRHHLDVAVALADLPVPGGAAGGFGPLLDPAARRRSFADWSRAALDRSIAAGGPRTPASADAARATDELLAALPGSTSGAPRFVHLDHFLGNVLADGDRVTAVLDVGPTAVSGIAHLDALATIAYLDPEVTPEATSGDRAVARAWAAELGLGDAVEPARRWLATMWCAALDDPALDAWCRRILA